MRPTCLEDGPLSWWIAGGVLVVLAVCGFGCAAAPVEWETAPPRPEPSRVTAERSEIVLQVGHALPVEALAATRDGRWILSGSADQTVKVWDRETGLLLRTLVGHSGAVTALAVTNDGLRAVSGSEDRTLIVWDLASGRKAGSPLQGHSGSVTAVVLTPDGKTLVSGGADGILKIWDMESGREIRALHGHGDAVTALALSADGRRLLSGSRDATARLWDLKSGTEVQVLSGPMDEITAVALWPDGARCLTAVGSGQPRVWDYPTLHLWDTETGKEIRAFRSRGTGVTALELLGNGLSILVAAQDGSLTLWDPDTGREFLSLQERGETVRTLVSVPRREEVVAAGDDGLPRLFALNEGPPLRNFPDAGQPLAESALTPDGFGFLSVQDGILQLRHLGTDREPRTFEGQIDGDLILEVLAGGEVLGWQPGRLTLWNLGTGLELWTVPLDGHRPPRALAMTPDEKLAMVGTPGGEVVVLNPASGVVVRTLRGHRKGITALAVTSNGRTVVSASVDKTLRVWDLRSGKSQRILTGHEDWVLDVAVTPDGRRAVSAGRDATLRIWDLKRGRLVTTFRGHTQGVRAAAVTPDGRNAVSVGRDRTIRLWDLETGRETWTLDRPGDRFQDVRVSSDGSLVLTRSQAGIHRIWNLRSGEEVVAVAAFRDGEGVEITPEGYYTATTAGEAHLAVRTGMAVARVDPSRAPFHRSDVVRLALDLGDSKMALKQILTGALSPPMEVPPMLLIGAPAAGEVVDEAEIDLRFEAQDQLREIQGWKVSLNGEEVRTGGDRGIEVEARSGRATGPQPITRQVRLMLVPGVNRIEVQVWTSEFLVSQKEIQVTYNAPRTAFPEAWVLSIGIDEYQDPAIESLSYAVADAKAIAELFQDQEGLQFRTVHTQLLCDGCGVEPTRANIVDAFQFLRGATQWDTVVIFIAGHGVNDAGGGFFLLGNDGAFNDDGYIKRSTAISLTEIAGDLAQIAGTKVILLDTCHAGGIAASGTTAQVMKLRAVDEGLVKRGLTGGESTLYLASTRANERSQERPEWGHGAFTHVLLKGLQGVADQGKDGDVTFFELSLYVGKKLVEVTGGAQHADMLTGSSAEGHLFDCILAKVRGRK